MSGPTLSQYFIGVFSDYEVVLEVDAEEFGGFTEAGGDFMVFLGGGGVTGGVVVGDDDGGGAEAQRRLEDLAGVDQAGVQGTDGDHFPADQGIARIKIESDEVLLLGRPDVGTEFTDLLGAHDDLRLLHELPPAVLEGRDDLHGFGVAEAFDGF